MDDILDRMFCSNCLNERELTLEFFLPLHLLSHPVEHWQLDPDDLPEETLGKRFKVVVRSKDRFDKRDKNRRRWLRRLRHYWDSHILQQTPEKGVQWQVTRLGRYYVVFS